VVKDPTSALSQPTITVAQLLKPYPEFVGITQTSLPYGRSHYDSLQAQVSKRTSHGLYFGVSYTVSKYMEAISYLNDNDAKPERVISDSDRPQRLIVHGIYELPFGPGRSFLNTRTPWIRRLAEGWQTMWVITYQSMAPLAFKNAERTNRPDHNPHTVDQWFDIRQFVPQEPFTLHLLSSRVADLRAPGIRKWDLTALKRTRITERVEMKFQAELYNAWNTTHFGTPNTTVTSGNFGRITTALLGPREIQLSARISF
jgi:hypothetical protein